MGLLTINKTVQDGIADRCLSFFSIDDGEHRGAKLATVQVLVLLITAIHQVNSARWIGAGFLLLCALIAILPRYRRAALVVALGWLIVRHVRTFPEISNHSYLEFTVLALACWMDTSKDEGRALLLQSYRWLTVLTFFHAGFQKLWYGNYIDGRMLAYMAGFDPSSRTAFELLLTRQEMDRLLSFRAVETPGPFLVESTFFLVSSNLAWFSELLVAALLLMPRTRRLGILIGMLMMIGIVFVAREFVFGMLMAALLCLFTPGDLNRKLLPVYLAIMLVMLGTRLEWLPLIRWR